MGQSLIKHTPESQLRHPRQLFKQMLVDLLASRELAWQLLIRDLRAQYRQSLLGFTWAFLPPIVTAAGMVMAKQSQVISIGATDLPYPAYVMFSMALWQTFVESLNGPVIAVTQAKQMLAKINFPREAIIISQIGQVFFNFSIKLILIIGLFIWFRIPITPSIIVAPVALIHLIFLGTAIGLLIAPFGTLYQDLSKGLTLATGFWLFLTPVIFPVPSREGLFGTLVNLNPVTPLLVTTRELATTGIISNPQGFWIASGLAIIGLLLVWIVYRLAMPFVIERMSA
ncbi:ABC-2 type transporter [Rippkaea orientalis PCC 8801]|uniref:ABC-2 type transporter n=1 Tax=Rippkaea orientalis (strain PCC 8801 / RF-1) TaxID=41431 RepID=B7K4C7_RIPO1|nr:ABC transporter permease [Rippkaea orientalis]ACK67833.1 ABC-2 type transporter [Rippkaea orientalis PCC 8801]